MEWPFSQIKMIKTRLQNRLLRYYLMKIATESSQYLSYDKHKEIVDIL